MPTFAATKTYELSGLSNCAQPRTAITGPTAEIVEQTLAVAWPGTLTTRTDDNTGTITMDDAGHLITTGARVDVYWEVGGVKGVQRGVTVGTVVTTSVPIDLGIGDNLPAQDSAVQVAIAEEFTFSVVGNDIAALVCGGDGRCTVVFCSGASTEELAKVFEAAGAYGWNEDDSETNPVAGDTLTKVFISQASTTQTVAVRAGALRSA